jgi:regulatory protein
MTKPTAFITWHSAFGIRHSAFGIRHSAFGIRHLALTRLMISAYSDALRMLARRELSVEGVRARLLDRDHPREAVESAIRQLLDNGALDDRRVALAHARTAAKVKGRGRLRVLRELAALGIARDVASEAVGEVFGELDERSLIAKAIQKKLRGRARLETPRDRASLYQFLMRQGFTPGAIVAALRKLPGGAAAEEV